MSAKNRTSKEISQLLSANAPDSPLKEVFINFELRKKYQLALIEALDLIGFSHFSNDVFIGQMNDKGVICLFTRHASIISRLKNKLPSLLHCFRESGFAVLEIQLKVLPKSEEDRHLSDHETPRAAPKPLSASQVQSWEILLKNTDQDSPTYQAIQDLINNAKKKS
jgi:hypothetical protein